MNYGCVADSYFIMDIVLEEAGEIFHGLIDVGGGHGTAAAAITRAIPHVKCTVLDLEQVISKAPDRGNLQLIVICSPLFHVLTLLCLRYVLRSGWAKF
jgi:hypothetical protein